jgi:hypothetical protein
MYFLCMYVFITIKIFSTDYIQYSQFMLSENRLVIRLEASFMC